MTSQLFIHPSIDSSITRYIHVHLGQGGQVRGGEAIETPSVHFGDAVSPVQFVAEVQAYLDRKRRTGEQCILIEEYGFNGTIFLMRTAAMNQTSVGKKLVQAKLL